MAANHHTTRRRFLQGTTAAAGVTAAGVMSIHRAAWAAGDDTLKIGMIGAGGRCTGAAGQFLAAHSNNRLIAMADLFKERLDYSHDALQRAHRTKVQVDEDHRFVGFDGWRKVIDSGVDVVLIACASKFHPMYTKAALEAGKHTFCEKPHAIDALGVNVLAEASAIARQKKLCYVSGLMSRYSNTLRAMTEQIRGGAIGDIVASNVYYLRAPYVTREPRPDEPETTYQFRNWYHFKWLSGDDVTQSLVHNLDRIAMFKGEAQPVMARGLGGRSASFGRKYGDQFDHHSVVYHYADGSRTMAYCTQQSGCSNGAWDYLIGTKGRMSHNKLFDHDGKVIWQYEGKDGSWHAQVQEAMSQAIRAGEKIHNGDYAAESTHRHHGPGRLLHRAEHRPRETARQRLQLRPEAAGLLLRFAPARHPRAGRAVPRPDPRSHEGRRFRQTDAPDENHCGADIMKIGFHTDAFNSSYWSFEKCLQWAEANEVHWIECGLIDGVSWIHGLGYQPHVAMYEDPLLLRRKMERHGVRFSQVDAAYPLSGKDGPAFGVPYVLRALQWAKLAGCDKIATTDGLHQPQGLDDPTAMDLMKRSYAQIIEVAQAYEITINIEVHGYFTTNPDRLAEMLAFVDSPWLRLNLDTGNSYIAGQDPVAFCERFKDSVTHVHVKDVSQSLAEAMRGKDTGIAVSHCAIGDGVNAENISKVLGILRDRDYHGVLSMECEGAGGPMIEKSLTWLRHKLNDLGITIET